MIACCIEHIFTLSVYHIPWVYVICLCLFPTPAKVEDLEGQLQIQNGEKGELQSESIVIIPSVTISWMGEYTFYS